MEIPLEKGEIPQEKAPPEKVAIEDSGVERLREDIDRAVNDEVIRRRERGEKGIDIEEIKSRIKSIWDPKGLTDKPAKKNPPTIH